jgi:GPI transamidase subunit PIG-U
VLSILTYIDIHYTILLIPILILLKQPVIPQEQALQPPRNNDTRTWVIISTVVLYILFSTVLQALSVLLVSWDAYRTIFIATHLHTFRSFQSTIRPNLSLLWYLGMELFVPFQAYFTLLLGALPYFTVIPLTIRLYHYPFVLACFLVPTIVSSTVSTLNVSYQF